MSKKSGKKKSTQKRRARKRQMKQASAPSPPARVKMQSSQPDSSAGKLPDETMRLIIEPSDAWLFRDGKPFRAGEDHWATSRFPPTSLTMQGVIRSKLLLDSNTSLAQYAAQPKATNIYNAIGGPTQNYGGQAETTDIHQASGRTRQNYGALVLRGPYLAHKKNGKWTRYYPTPADLLCDKENREFCRLTVGDTAVAANWPTGAALRPLRPPSERDEVEPACGWIAAEALYAYLAKGECPTNPKQVVRAADVYTTEERIAIGLDRRVRRPHLQLLTEIGMIRMHTNWALDVEISGIPQWNSPGYLGIGGEARAGYYKVLSPEPPVVSPAPLPDRFVLYFATPTWFKNGWLPEDWGKWFTGGQVNLVAAVVNRAERIGGWDIVQGEKPMRAYVPAGSVYYFECNGDVTYNGEPVTDDPAGGQIGFGQAFTGQWSEPRKEHNNVSSN